MGFTTKRTRYVVQQLDVAVPAFDEMQEQLLRAAFAVRPWTSGEVVRVGACAMDSLNEFGFEDPELWSSERIFTFGFRIDKKKVPGKVMKARVDQAVRNWKKTNGVDSIPHTMRRELKDRIVEELLQSALPVPKMVEIVIDRDTGTLYTCGATTNEMDDLSKWMRRSFNVSASTFSRKAKIEMRLSKSRSESERKLVRDLLATDAQKILAQILRAVLDGESEGFTVKHDGESYQFILGERVKMDDLGKDLALVISGESNAGEAQEALGKGMVPTEVLFLVLHNDEVLYHLKVKSDNLNVVEIDTPTPPGTDSMVREIEVKKMMIDEAENVWDSALIEAIRRESLDSDDLLLEGDPGDEDEDEDDEDDEDEDGRRSDEDDLADEA